MRNSNISRVGIGLLAVVGVSLVTYACQRDVAGPTDSPFKQVAATGKNPTSSHRLSAPTKSSADVGDNIAGEVFSVALNDDAGHLNTFVYQIDATGELVERLDVYQDDERNYGVQLQWQPDGTSYYASTVTEVGYDNGQVDLARTSYYQAGADSKWRPAMGGTPVQEIPIARFVSAHIAGRHVLLAAVMQESYEACGVDAIKGAIETAFVGATYKLSKRTGSPAIPSTPEHIGATLTCLVAVAKDLYHGTANAATAAWRLRNADAQFVAVGGAVVVFTAISKGNEYYNAVTGTVKDMMYEAGQCATLLGASACTSIVAKMH